uniref:Carboxypeptidase Q n=1 Tax=Ditylenchus dipsaci TaxID=166011 RepID=A0A915CL36_9BILA
MPAVVTASVVVLKDFKEFEATNVTGKIVLFSPLWQGYGKTVAYRGAWQRVKNKGGVGLLVKSITPFSIGSAHTGSGGSGATIPTGCIPIEEVELIERLYNRQKEIVVQMSFKSTMKEETSSRNTVFEIKGSQWPNQIVLLSAHMDSWDVGQGAMDDGGGMAAVWQAMKCILDMSKHDSNYAPKRTIRGVFWTAEEQGYFGSQAYYKSHSSNSNENIFFVSETDNGAFKPLNFNSSLKFAGNENQKNRIKQIVQLLNEYEIPLSVRDSTDQGDVGFWTKDKVPGVNYSSDKGANYYFYFHHSNGDYMTVFKEGDIDYTAAIFSSLAHVLANMDDWKTE